MTYLCVTSLCFWDSLHTQDPHFVLGVQRPQGMVWHGSCSRAPGSHQGMGMAPQPPEQHTLAQKLSFAPWWMYHQCTTSSVHHITLISTFWFRAGLVWACSWGKKWAGAAEWLRDPAAALSPLTAKTALLPHSRAILAHLLCKQFTQYPPCVWCSFRDFLLKILPQRRFLKEQVWQQEELPYRVFSVGGRPLSHSIR